MSEVVPEFLIGPGSGSSVRFLTGADLRGNRPDLARGGLPGAGILGPGRGICVQVPPTVKHLTDGSGID